MKTEINQVLVELKQMNSDLKQNCIRLKNLAEKMGIVIHENRIMNVDMREINARLVAMIDRYEEREQRHLKVVR